MQQCDEDDPESLIFKLTNLRQGNQFGMGLRIFIVMNGLALGDLARVEDLFFNEFQATATEKASFRTPKCYASLLQDGTEPPKGCFICCNTIPDCINVVLLEDLRDYQSFTPFCQI